MTNEEVLGMARVLSAKSGTYWKRVGYKQAWVSEVMRDRFVLIKSYSTIVGLIDCEEDVLYEIGKYSRTTSKQITQINQSLFPSCKRVYVEGRV